MRKELAAALSAAVRSEEVTQALDKAEFDPLVMEPAAIAKRLLSDGARPSEAVKATGNTAEDCDRPGSAGSGRRGREAQLGRWMCAPDHAFTCLFQFDDQGVDARNELVPVRVRAVVDQTRGLISKHLLTCHACPAADFAIREQRQATKVAATARKVHFSEEILEAELEGFNVISHVALQQFTAGYPSAPAVFRTGTRIAVPITT